MDPDIRPQDDLFGHVNERWMAEAELPADRSNCGPFVQLLADLAEEQVHRIIEDLAAAATSAHHDELNEDAQKIGDLFASFMDTERSARLGIRPVPRSGGLGRGGGTLCRGGNCGQLPLVLENASALRRPPPRGVGTRLRAASRHPHPWTKTGGPPPTWMRARRPSLRFWPPHSSLRTAPRPDGEALPHRASLSRGLLTIPLTPENASGLAPG